MIENWLVHKPRYAGWWSSLALTFSVLAVTLLSWSSPDLQELFQASPIKVFQHHQYYRLWTSLFVHADGAHLLSNMILFVPLIYLLSAYFGSLLWPILAIAIGGLVNALVLKTLSPEVNLIGISGVDNWLGATWLTLFFLIDRRENRRRRFAVVLFVSFVLFVPDTYKPSISYLSHFLGYIFGVMTGVGYYFLNQQKFKAAEVYKFSEEENLFSLETLHNLPASQDEMSNF